MLLVLTLIYIFHGFQIYAAPVTSVFAESAGTALSCKSTCVCPTDQRSLWDILWSSLATIFACSWASVHPNIPASNDSGWKLCLRRIELMFWAILGPELVIVWAFRQWLGARHFEKLYKERGWTKTHGYFIQMGGFMLFEGNVAKGVLSQEMFSEFLTAGKIEFPTITVEEIEDRSKGDSLSKTIVVGQTLWFIVQCIARRAQHLDFTLIELLTLSLAVLNGVMYSLWWHKPLDVRCPVRVYLLDEPNEPKECNEPNTLNKSDKPDKSDDSDSALEINGCFGLSSVLKSVFSDSKVSPKTKVSSEAEVSPEPSPETTPETGVVPESLEPSSQETPKPTPGILVRVITWIIIAPILIPAGIALLVLALLFLLLFVGSFSILFPLWLLYHLTTRWIGIMLEGGEFNRGDMNVPTFSSYKPQNGEERASFLLVSAAGVVFGGIHCAGWFFTFPSHDEAILWRVCSVVLTGIALLLPPLCYFDSVVSGSLESLAIATTILAITIYVVSRLLLLVEAFVSLRHLTPGMLAVVTWTSFIPHI